MSQPAKAHEPSMEEILASIRRIIADDETGKAPPPKPAPASMAPVPPPRPAAMPPRAAAPPPPPPVPEPSAVDAMLAGRQAASNESHDILDLTESMAAPAEHEEASNFQTIDGQPDVIFTDPPAPPEPVPPPREEPPMGLAGRRGPDHGIMSASTSAAVDSAFNALAQTVLVHNARTLEDLVREMLRPMLKSWLDDNLPSLVERIVKAEIDRVARGR
jgi:hypothetical protein